MSFFSGVPFFTLMTLLLLVVAASILRSFFL